MVHFIMHQKSDFPSSRPLPSLETHHGGTVLGLMLEARQTQYGLQSGKSLICLFAFECENVACTNFFSPSLSGNNKTKNTIIKKIKVLTFLSILMPGAELPALQPDWMTAVLMSRRYMEKKQSNLCQNAPVSQCARDVTGSRSEASAVIGLICMSSLASAPGQWTCR